MNITERWIRRNKLVHVASHVATYVDTVYFILTRRNIPKRFLGRFWKTVKGKPTVKHLSWSIWRPEDLSRNLGRGKTQGNAPQKAPCHARPCVPRQILRNRCKQQMSDHRSMVGCMYNRTFDLRHIWIFSPFNCCIYLANFKMENVCFLQRGISWCQPKP